MRNWLEKLSKVPMMGHMTGKTVWNKIEMDESSMSADMKKGLKDIKKESGRGSIEG